MRASLTHLSLRMDIPIAGAGRCKYKSATREDQEEGFGSWDITPALIVLWLHSQNITLISSHCQSCFHITSHYTRLSPPLQNSFNFKKESSWKFSVDEFFFYSFLALQFCTTNFVQPEFTAFSKKIFCCIYHTHTQSVIQLKPNNVKFKIPPFLNQSKIQSMEIICRNWQLVKSWLHTISFSAINSF